MKTTLYIILLLWCILSCSKPDQDTLSITVSIPNAFRPNDKNGIVNSSAPCIDGNPNCNQVFKVLVSNPNNIGYEFDLAIYSLQGKLLFHTTKPNVGWNGQIENLGDHCPQGNYHYKLHITETHPHQSKLFEGGIVLLR
jgi:hypothetical protein